MTTEEADVGSMRSQDIVSQQMQLKSKPRARIVNRISRDSHCAFNSIITWQAYNSIITLQASSVLMESWSPMWRSFDTARPCFQY